MGKGIRENMVEKKKNGIVKIGVILNIAGVE